MVVHVAVALALVACGCRSRSPEPQPAAIGSAHDEQPRAICSGRWVGSLPDACAPLGDLSHFAIELHAKGSAWDVRVASPAGAHIEHQDISWSAAAGGCIADLVVQHGTHGMILTLTNGANAGALMHFRGAKHAERTGAAPPAASVITAEAPACHGDATVTFTPDDGALPTPDPALAKVAGAYTPTVVWSERACGVELPSQLSFHVVVDRNESNALRADDLDLMSLFGYQAINETIDAGSGALAIDQDYIYLGATQAIEAHATMSIADGRGSVHLSRLVRNAKGEETRCNEVGTLSQAAPR